jgi:serine O-acetyltransferase
MIDKFLKSRREIEKLLTRLFRDTKTLELVQARNDIRRDLQFLYNNDPSVKSIDDVSVYTSAFAVACYRIAHALTDIKLARGIMEYAKSLTGVDIHPSAKIGVPFCIDHGVGTVIGETAVIGDNCMLYHGVTLGAKHLKEREQQGIDRHPKLGDNVIVYSNTTILGSLHIPSGMIIGANKFIRKQEEIDQLYNRVHPQ